MGERFVPLVNAIQIVHNLSFALSLRFLLATAYLQNDALSRFDFFHHIIPPQYWRSRQHIDVFL